MTQTPRPKDTLSDTEIATREEAALRTLLATPPKPHEAKGKRRVESQSK